jgi:hypothetical protein
MAKYQAQLKAHALWHRCAHTSSPTVAIGDRDGLVCLHRKSVTDRYEVGYIELIHTPASDFQTRWQRVVLGRGVSWKEAFERATRRMAQEVEEQRGALDVP